MVGLAELLCAVLFLAALLLYMAAAGSGVAVRGRRPATLLAAAMGCAVCAALAKELGVTVVSSPACRRFCAESKLKVPFMTAPYVDL